MGFAILFTDDLHCSYRFKCRQLNDNYDAVNVKIMGNDSMHYYCDFENV